jgi:hypothetical protein
MKWLRFLKFWDKTKKEDNNESSGGLRRLSPEEAMDLESGLAEIGMEFNSVEDAEKYFFEIRDNDLKEMKAVEEKFPELTLDYKAQSLARLEEFYYKVFVDKKIELDIPKERFEELFTQYMRQVFVNTELAEWMVFENDFAEGRYYLGLMYAYGSGGEEHFAENLDSKEKEEGRKYLYTKYMYYVPEEWEQKVQ